MNNEDKIDRYLAGIMEENERLAFEELIAHDQNLAAEVDAMGHFLTALERKEEKEAVNSFQGIASEERLREIILNVEQNHTKVSTKKRFVFRNVYTYVSIGIVAALFCGLLPRYSTVFLYEKYYVSADYEFLISRNGVDLPIERQVYYENARLFYQSDDFQNAVEQFEFAFAGLLPNEIPIEGKFYYAVALLKSGFTDKAIFELTSFINQPGEYQDDALWQLAFGYLIKKDRKKAIKILTILSQREGFYQEKASNLRADLKQKILF